MSLFYETDPKAQYWQAAEQAAHPMAITENGPGVFDGALTAPFTGVASFAAKGGLLLGDALDYGLKPVAKAVDKAADTDIAGYLDHLHQQRVATVRALAPDPKKTGLVGNVIHGLTNVVPEFVIGSIMGGPAGGAALAGAMEGYADVRVKQAEGVDSVTALGVGATTGVSTAVGGLLPVSMGFKALPDLVFGAGSNMASNAAGRALTSHILESNGYKDMAEQYKWNDMTALAVDGIMGAAFNVAGRYVAGKPGEAHRIPERQLDAAMAANDALNAERGIVPGLHADPVSREAGTLISDEIARAMVDGREPQIAEFVRALNLTEDPVRTAHDVLTAKALADVGGLPEQRVKVEHVPLEPKAPMPDNLAKAVEEAMQPKAHDGTTSSIASAANILPLEAEVTKQLLDRNPDFEIATPEGPVKLAEAAKKADVEIEQAVKDRKLMDVLVACATGG